MSNHKWRSWADETDNQQLIFWERRLEDAKAELARAMHEIGVIRNRCVKRKTAYARKTQEDREHVGPRAV
jgi:hypothetical protein